MSSTSKVIWRRGYRWDLPTACELDEGLDAVFDTFPRVEELAGARVLKRNIPRTVVHVPRRGGEGDGWLVKAYRYVNRRDRLRFRWLRHRAAQEFHVLRRLAGLGLPVPRCIALAERREGLRGLVEGGLVTTYLIGHVPLAEKIGSLLDEGGDPEGEFPAGALLEAAGRLTFRLHECGVWHRDLHAGNILHGDGSRELVLVDVHSCSFLPRLPGRLRRRGVAKLVHSLGSRIPARGVDCLLAGYGPGALARGADLPRARTIVLREVERIERRRIASRSKRCFIDSSRFSVEHGDCRVLYRRRELPAADLSPCLDLQPDSTASLAVGGRLVRVVSRRYRVLESLLALLRPHPLRRAYAIGHRLDVLGVPAPRVLALQEIRRFLMVREARLVTDRFEDAVPPSVLLGNVRARWRHDLARQAGRLLRKLHAAGVSFRKPGASSFLLEGGAKGPPRLLLGDLDLKSRRGTLPHRRRRDDLAGAAAALAEHVSRTDLLRALVAYGAGGDGRPALRALAAELREEVLRRLLRRICAHGGFDGAHGGAQDAASRG